MSSGDIAKFIGKNNVLRRIAYFLIFITTLREWYIRSRLSRIISQLPEDFSLLDAGSGLGQYAISVGRANSHARVIAYELDGDQVSDCRDFAARQNLENVQFYVNDLSKDICDVGFDIILCGSVLEHIERDEKVLKQFYSALKRNGRLLVYVPSREHRVLSSLNRMQNQIIKKSGKRYLHQHVRYYDPVELQTKLQRVGFEMEEVTITYGEFGALAYDLVTQVQYSRLFKYIFPFYFFFVHPFVLVLMLADFYRKNTTGNGLLVVAKKKGAKVK